jgi:exo-beta-1,3-glucanase (GH17 family)
VTSHLKIVGRVLAGLFTMQFFFQSSQASAEYTQSPDKLLHGQVMAVAYSGFREGQHPDRGEGAVNPGDEQILEDLKILSAHQFKLIRVYDSGENSASTLRLIRQHELPIKVLLGIWLKAEVSNHEGCAWLDTPIPEAELAANKLLNDSEVARGITLAKQYSDIVVAVNVGNEALVDWNDHMVLLSSVIDYVRRVKESIEQPVTVADNYAWWIHHGAPLAEELDFIGVHTYPVWENKTIDQGLAYTVQNIEEVQRALPDKPIVVLEGGWPTTASEFSDQANETNQARYYREVYKWAEQTNTTFMFFEAFDEPWKGHPDNPDGAEKHWGLFNVDRTPKQVTGNR